MNNILVICCLRLHCTFWTPCRETSFHGSVSRGRYLPLTYGARVCNSQMIFTRIQHITGSRHLITAPLCPRESPALSLLNNYSSPSWLAGTLMSECVCVCVRHWYLFCVSMSSFSSNANAALHCLSLPCTHAEATFKLSSTEWRMWW